LLGKIIHLLEASPGLHGSENIRGGGGRGETSHAMKRMEKSREIDPNIPSGKGVCFFLVRSSAYSKGTVAALQGVAILKSNRAFQGVRRSSN